jgi:sodium-dependent dicarboxylate transporter 2/3/5
MSFAEKVVLADFCVLVLLWLTRATVTIGGLQLYGWPELLPEEHVGGKRVPFMYDGSVSIAAAVALFLIPARPGSRETVMDWPTAVKLPWDVVLIFGGGFALAGGFTESGLSGWLGNRLAAAGALPPLVTLTIICLLVTFLTELTSNTATSQTLLPITAALSVECGVNPLFLMVPVTIASSLGFMMPAGTPPNAIVFGTRRVSIFQMATTGLALNLMGVVLLVLAMYTLGLGAWGITLGELPSWAAPAQGPE